MPMHIAARAPVGFVVEGKGEHQAYPSLVGRLLGARGLKLPRAAADGCGDVIENLHEHLDDLVSAHRPYKVLITLDLEDVVPCQAFPSCQHLIGFLNGRVENWVTNRAGNKRFEPLPTAIIPVVQIRQFETWWLADPEGLAGCRLFDVNLAECTWADVDMAVDNPVQWLTERQRVRCKLKRPSIAREVVSSLDPTKMRQRSPSFDKFSREVLAGYNAWLAELAGG